MSIKCSERLAEAGIKPTIGSASDSYDNALAETVNGLQNRGDPQARTLAKLRSCRVRHAGVGDWFYNHLLEPIGKIPPAEVEDQYYSAADNIGMSA